MSRTLDILGVGDADVDLYVKVPHLPGRDEKVLGEPLGLFCGGMVANYCCAASRLGSRAGLISLVGDDTYGRMALADLDRFGVDRRWLVVRPGGTTYYCLIMLDDSGEKALTVVRTDCMGPGRSDIDPAAFDEARLVHTAAHDLELAAWVARTAKEHGCLVSLDLEGSARAQGMDALRALLRSVDWVFPNEAGVQALFDCAPEEGARALLALGPSLAVVTMGARGSLVATTDGQLQVPAFPVAVRDTTGAGDCFNAAFATGRLKGHSLEEAARYATGAAALSVTRVGSRSAIPAPAEVEEFLHSRAR